MWHVLNVYGICVAHAKYCWGLASGIQKSLTQTLNYLKQVQRDEAPCVSSDLLLTSVVSSWRRLWSRSTSSISYTLISKGSFNGPDIGGKSTHWPAVPAFFPREEVSGRGAGISRLLWKPTKPCIWSDRHQLRWWHTMVLSVGIFD